MTDTPERRRMHPEVEHLLLMVSRLIAESVDPGSYDWSLDLTMAG